MGIQKKTCRKTTTDKSQNYPESTIMPADTSYINTNFRTNIKNRDNIKNNPCPTRLPTSQTNQTDPSQTDFPEYCHMPNIVRPKIQSLKPMPVQLPVLWRERPMVHKYTQTEVAQASQTPEKQREMVDNKYTQTEVAQASQTPEKQREMVDNKYTQTEVAQASQTPEKQREMVDNKYTQTEVAQASQTPEKQREMVDNKYTQTEVAQASQTSEFTLLIQTCKITLHQRFEDYEKIRLQRKVWLLKQKRNLVDDAAVERNKPKPSELLTPKNAEADDDDVIISDATEQRNLIPQTSNDSGTNKITAPNIISKTQNIDTNPKTINCDPTADKTGDFKIPKLTQLRNRTNNGNITNTSVHVESPTVSDEVRKPLIKTMDYIDKNLKKFCVKSKIMKEKISTRIDEWLCTFTQIIEDTFNNLLQNDGKYMKDTAAPLNLHDTLKCVKMLYDTTQIKDFVDHLSELLDKCICVKGVMKTPIRPDDFMEMFGCGVLLIASLKEILPLSEDLLEAESSLGSLLSTIESNAVEFDIDEWASYKEDFDSQDHKSKIQNSSDNKPLKTFGENLNFLKIHKGKAISLAENYDKKYKQESPKIKESIDNKETGNTACDDFTEDVILGNSDDFCINKMEGQLGYITKSATENFCTFKSIENAIDNNDNSTMNNDSSTINSDSTYAHLVVKMFLHKLVSTFRAIYEFVNRFGVEFGNKELFEVRKNVLHSQAIKSLEELVIIIGRLRTIIKRETADVTELKTLLLNAGAEATSDKRITSYRETVTKALEQAQILQDALEIIANVTIEDLTPSQKA